MPKGGHSKVGRKRMPRELRELGGNATRRPLPPPDISTESVGEPPVGLGKIEQSTWNTIRAECGWLRAGDRALLELYCRSHFTMCAAQKKLGSQLTGRSKALGGGALLALRLMYSNSRSDCLKILIEMGATPTARSKVLDTGGKGVNTTDRFFTGAVIGDGK